MANQSGKPTGYPRVRALLNLTIIILALTTLATYLAGWLPKSYDEVALAAAAAVILFTWLRPILKPRHQTRAARSPSASDPT